MAKKRKVSDKFSNRKPTPSIKSNPFEIHLNKEKFKVLGRQGKNDKGIPGISRSKGIKKRKQTLLEEYKLRTKSNLFKDKRLGARNSNNNSHDDILMARYAAVKMKSHKKSIYNLADDEILTHKGQTLSEIEKFEEPMSSDEDPEDNEDEKAGRLGAKHVEDAHFGGGLLSHKKTHKELMDELISESKKRKEERQKLKEQSQDLTQKLDAEWKELLPLVNSTQKNDIKRVADDYDKTVASLKFEPRGSVGDKLKSEEEIAKEEKEKLEALEKERLERMRGVFDSGKSKTVMRSVDELDDIEYESDDANDMLTYDSSGKSNVNITAFLNGKEIGIKDDSDDDNDQDKDDNDQEDENSKSEDESEVAEEKEMEVEEEEEESKDNYSDLQSESEEENDDVDEQEPSCENQASHVNSNMNVETPERKEEEINGEKIKLDLLKRKEMMDKARAELPYVFPFPETYEDLQELFTNRDVTHINIIVERIIKTNHPSLAEGNKDKLAKLLVYLIQYLVDVCSSSTSNNSTVTDTVQQCFDTLKALTTFIYDIANYDKKNTYNCFSGCIKEKHEEYSKHTRTFPGLENLIIFKLVSLLFTTSDFRHKIVTPCFIYIDQMLTKCRVKTRRDISYGLFLTTLILEYTSLSKRYRGSAITFLSGLLHMAIPKTGVRIIKVLPPFRSISNHLVLMDRSVDVPELKMNSKDLEKSSEITEEFKIRATYTALKLIKEFHGNLKELPSVVEIFDPILRYLTAIPVENYPKVVKDEITSLIDSLEESKSERKLHHLVVVNKPKTLKFLEPEIEEIFDRKMHQKSKSAEKTEIDKLLHKLKRETKGAMREIRRDKSFLARVKIQQQVKSDKERKEKVNKLFAEASIQQSELNALDRSKKRKR